MLARTDLHGPQRTVGIYDERAKQHRDAGYAHLKSSGCAIVLAETGSLISCTVRDMSAICEIAGGSLHNRRRRQCLE